MQRPENDSTRATAASLADFLEEHKDALVEKWAARVLRDPKVPSAASLSQLALYDHFPAIVDRIVATLRTVAERAEELGATMGSAEEAQIHVRDRAEAEYSVPEVLRELSHLRLAIIELSEDTGLLPDRASGTILHAAFDHMMISAAEELSRLERLAREQLEAAHVAKDHFLAMISHELRTPLNAISGWSQMLARGGNDPALRARAVETIQRNARAQGHLIESVLDITRLKDGRAEMRREPVDLAPLLRATLESFNPALRDKQIRVETSLPESAPPVLGDEQRVRQVFTNLLGNAIKFTPRAGVIRVSLKNDPDTVRVEISDSGVGIPVGFLPHVFEPFRQADASWSREHGGLGLGLAITKALVELHGGTIEAASQGEGKGASFSVTLPVATTVVRTSDVPLLAVPGGVEHRLGGLRVLVVDDATDGRELVGAILERAGATVEQAASGAEGLEAVRRVRPDVIVSDLAMPGMDGLRFLQQVRAEVGDIPAIAVSAFTSPQAIEEAKAAGFRSHMAKPIALADLLQAVSETVQQPSIDPSGIVRKQPSVLVVEDDHAIREELAAILRDRGLSVRVAEDGAKAWSMLTEDAYRPSVILLDLMMPEMDGWTLRRRLLEKEHLASIPVVLMTGAQPDEISVVERVQTVIHKPFDVGRLLEVVDEHARSSAADGPLP